MDLIKDGTIQDAKTIIGLQATYLTLLDNHEEVRR